MPNQSFHDLFGGRARDYVKFRPGYPRELFDFIVAQAPARSSAWDSGTGSGQAAVSLADYFETVYATDVNADQIAQAEQRANVQYKVAPSEASGLPDGSIDLITAANALHWFDIPKFFAEAERVLKPDGAIAVWCYSNVYCEHVVDAVLNAFKHRMKPYWPAPIQLVNDKYRTLDFPFVDVDASDFELREQWSIERLLGYVSTWSAVQNYRAANSDDPIVRLGQELASAGLTPSHTCTVTFPLHLRLGKNA